MTFEEFKQLLEYREETTYYTREESPDCPSTRDFRARLQVQALRKVNSDVFELDEQGVRDMMHDVLAKKIYDMCMEVFGPNYTVDDLKTAYAIGQYSDNGFEDALRKINRRKGLVNWVIADHIEQQNGKEKA